MAVLSVAGTVAPHKMMTTMVAMTMEQEEQHEAMLRHRGIQGDWFGYLASSTVAST